MRRDDLCPDVRQRLERLPPPYQAHYGVVAGAPPSDILSIDAIRLRHEAASAALARIDALARELCDPYLVSRVLTRREAVSSSSIEGTNSTLDELLSVEEAADGGASSAAKQVRDYALALDAFIPRARSEGPKIFSLELVKELHRCVMRDDPGYADVPGEFRTRVVWIGGRGDIAYSIYNPPPPSAIERCLNDTIAYMRDDDLQSMRQSLLTRMAVAHAHFESVHPYRDGNGRVGRLLVPLMMAAEGHVPLYLSSYIEANRATYMQALKAAQQRLEWHELTGFISDAVVGTEAELMATRHALSRLGKFWYSRRMLRKGSTAMRTLDILPHYPVLTGKRLAELLDVTFAAASNGLRQLVEAGILTERTGYARNRVFVAEEALRVINRPYGTEPVLSIDMEHPPDPAAQY